jgi:hypothetical protein
MKARNYLEEPMTVLVDSDVLFFALVGITALGALMLAGYAAFRVWRQPR